LGDYVKVRPIRRRHPALGNAQRPFVLATLFGRPDLKDERFAEVNQRVINGEALDELLVEAAKDRTMGGMFKTASEQYRMLFGIVQTPADLAAWWERASTLIQLCKSLGEGRSPGTSAGTKRNAS